MDGLGHSFDHLGARECFTSKSVTILFEVDKRCREILKHHRVRPGVILSDYQDSSNTIGSAIAPLEDNDAFFTSLLRQLPDLRLIFVCSGSPCVGFSRAKTNRQGVKDPESEKIWVLPVAVARLDLLCKSLFTEVVSIAFICENADMSETPDDLRNRQAIRDTLKVDPILIQASKRCACDRNLIGRIWSSKTSSSGRHPISGTRVASALGISGVDLPARSEILYFLAPVQDRTTERVPCNLPQAVSSLVH